MQFQKAWDWIQSPGQRMPLRTVIVVAGVHIAVTICNLLTDKKRDVFVQAVNVDLQKDVCLYLPALCIRERDVFVDILTEAVGSIIT